MTNFQEWQIFRNDEFLRMKSFREWRNFENDNFSGMTNFLEWVSFRNDEFLGMTNFKGMTNFQDWQIFGNDEFLGMTNFQEWQIFGNDDFSGARDEFFWPSIFYPLRALGSEYLRSCFFKLGHFQKIHFLGFSGNVCGAICWHTIKLKPEDNDHFPIIKDGWQFFFHFFFISFLSKTF